MPPPIPTPLNPGTAPARLPCHAEASTCSLEGSSPAKLFIFNLARTVTDGDLLPLFAPFSPLYATVAVGKKVRKGLLPVTCAC